jgi:hypothetical protein
MKAFLSYSLRDSQEYVVTIMARQLQEKGYTLMTHAGSGLTSDPLSWTLRGCGLFIGVVTTQSDEYNRVIQEYNQACAWQIPALLLYEYNAALYEGVLDHPNVVVFDRYNPDPTLQEVRNRIAWARTPQPKKDDSAAWVLGGAAVLALIALLSNGRK